ncbi:protein of unknown function [Hymenobacter gelipurpurascens]|uniref:DUF4468 domain-containing protein n=1 Tax=Hymenobacter gelipurpurascens TaxID=89968 RepID=A0A212UGJ6_9BACT|nr:DUF4468 domain-containing protein [Hymenobacter gelipurpurascens]SNC77271.1 protein of unknown function [Hymenobacter gelipurpurascens]
MKNILWVLLLSLAVQARGQAPVRRAALGLPLDSVTHRVSYHGTLLVPGVPAAELYGRAQEWVAREFEDSRQVLHLTDPARGVLIGRAMTMAHGPLVENASPRDFQLSFLFCLRFTDGRCTYEFTDLSYPSNLVTSATSSSSGGQVADALAEWTNKNLNSRISTAEAQTARARIEPDLESDTNYDSKGRPRPRLLRDVRGIDTAMRAVLASFSQTTATKP